MSLGNKRCSYTISDLRKKRPEEFTEDELELFLLYGSGSVVKEIMEAGFTVNERLKDILYLQRKHDFSDCLIRIDLDKYKERLKLYPRVDINPVYLTEETITKELAEKYPDICKGIKGFYDLILEEPIKIQLYLKHVNKDDMDLEVLMSNSSPIKFEIKEEFISDSIIHKYPNCYFTPTGKINFSRNKYLDLFERGTLRINDIPKEDRHLKLYLQEGVEIDFENVTDEEFLYILQKYSYLLSGVSKIDSPNIYRILDKSIDKFPELSLLYNDFSKLNIENIRPIYSSKYINTFLAKTIVYNKNLDINVLIKIFSKLNISIFDALNRFSDGFNRHRNRLNLSEESLELLHDVFELKKLPTNNIIIHIFRNMASRDRINVLFKDKFYKFKDIFVEHFFEDYIKSLNIGDVITITSSTAQDLLVFNRSLINLLRKKKISLIIDFSNNACHIDPILLESKLNVVDVMNFSSSFVPFGVDLFLTVDVNKISKNIVDKLISLDRYYLDPRSIKYLLDNNIKLSKPRDLYEGCLKLKDRSGYLCTLINEYENNENFKENFFISVYALHDKIFLETLKKSPEIIKKCLVPHLKERTGVNTFAAYLKDYIGYLNKGQMLLIEENVIKKHSIVDCVFLMTIHNKSIDESQIIETCKACQHEVLSSILSNEDILIDVKMSLKMGKCSFCGN